MDNQAAIKQFECKVRMSSTKNVDVRVKFDCNYAKPVFVESEFLKVNWLTKALTIPRLEELQGLCNRV